MEAIDRDIERVLRGLSLEGRNLPFTLGLSSRREARWSDFIQLPPNRDLPSWACEPLEGTTWFSRERVALFDRAHHIAIAWGLVADRVDDGQVERSDELDEVRESLRGAWLEALTEATGDARMAAAAVGAAVREWAAGVVRERAWFARRAGVEGIGEYGECVEQRLRWVSTTACAMLVVAGEPTRATALRTAYGVFLRGLQCRDDAYDADEDRATRGAAVHEVLQLPHAGLLRGAPQCLYAAARTATRGGFARCGAWMEQFAEAVEACERARATLQDEFAALLFAPELEGEDGYEEMSR